MPGWRGQPPYDVEMTFQSGGWRLNSEPANRNPKTYESAAMNQLIMDGGELKSARFKMSTASARASSPDPIDTTMYTGRAIIWIVLFALRLAVTMGLHADFAYILQLIQVVIPAHPASI